MSEQEYRVYMQMRPARVCGKVVIHGRARDSSETKKNGGRP